MTTKLIYKIITTIGEETANGNAAFKQLEQLVNEHIREGWTAIEARGQVLILARNKSQDLISTPQVPLQS